MNDVKKEKTVPLTSVGADDGQSNQKPTSSITEASLGRRRMVSIAIALSLPDWRSPIKSPAPLKAMSLSAISKPL